MLPIPEEHIIQLKLIAETHDLRFYKESDRMLMAHFLDNRWVLNYRKGSDWYAVHPLLRTVVDNDLASGTLKVSAA